MTLIFSVVLRRDFFFSSGFLVRLLSSVLRLMGQGLGMASITAGTWNGRIPYTVQIPRVTDLMTEGDVLFLKERLPQRNTEGLDFQEVLGTVGTPR